jgi:hypothetical protein
MTSGDGVKGELSRLAQAFLVSSQAISEKLAALLKMAGALKAELHTSSEVAERGIEVIAAFDDMLRKLDEKLDELGYQPEADRGLGGDQQGAGLSKLYSMESERLAHQQVFGGMGEVAEDTAAPNGATSDLGDDVELF